MKKTPRSRLALWAVAVLTPLAGLTAGSAALAQNTPSGTGPIQGGLHAKAAMCLGCHNIPGYQASFPEVHKVPMIAGQSAKYISAALLAYQKGDRRHPTMKAVAASLTEKDMADLAEFYASQGKGQPGTRDRVGKPSAEVDALLKKGNCIACHGADLNSPIDPTYPKIAGQHPDYLYVSLKSYQQEKNANIGRSNAIMAAQARLFTHQELKLMADYIGGMAGDLKTVPQSRFR